MSIKPLTACIPASRLNYCLPGNVPFNSRKAATSTAFAPNLRSTRALRRPSALSWHKILSRPRRRPDMGFVAASKTAGANSKICLLACNYTCSGHKKLAWRAGLTARAALDTKLRVTTELGALWGACNAVSAALRPAEQRVLSTRAVRESGHKATSMFATSRGCCQGQEHVLPRSSVPARERLTVLSSLLLPPCPTEKAVCWRATWYAWAQAAAAAEGLGESVPELGEGPGGPGGKVDQTLRERLDFRPRLSPAQVLRLPTGLSSYGCASSQ